MIVNMCVGMMLRTCNVHEMNEKNGVFVSRPYFMAAIAKII